MPLFRLCATVSRIGLLESRLRRRCRWCGGPPPPDWLPPSRDGWLGRSAFALTKRTCLSNKAFVNKNKKTSRPTLFLKPWGSSHTERTRLTMTMKQWKMKRRKTRKKYNNNNKSSQNQTTRVQTGLRYDQHTRKSSTPKPCPNIFFSVFAETGKMFLVLWLFWGSHSTPIVKKKKKKFHKTFCKFCCWGANWFHVGLLSEFIGVACFSFQIYGINYKSSLNSDDACKSTWMCSKFWLVAGMSLVPKRLRLVFSVLHFVYF